MRTEKCFSRTFTTNIFLVACVHFPGVCVFLSDSLSSHCSRSLANNRSHLLRRLDVIACIVLCIWRSFKMNITNVERQCFFYFSYFDSYVCTPRSVCFKICYTDWQEKQLEVRP